jgi:cytochrome c2
VRSAIRTIPVRPSTLNEPFGGLGDAKDIDDVIAYLKEYK